jgi:hypothetical protein
MKAAFLDLNDTMCGMYTDTAPLGLGLIAGYLTKKIDHFLE